MEQRLDDTGFEGVARTADYRPERDGVANFDKGISLASEPVPVVRAVNFLEQAAHVNDLQDESMTPLYRALFNIYGNAFGSDKAVTGYGRSYPYHPDQSYGEAEKQAGQAAVQYVNKGLGPKSPVHGIDGSRPAGEADQSTGKLVPAVFRNMNHDAVAKAGEDIGIS